MDEEMRNGFVLAVIFLIAFFTGMFMGDMGAVFHDSVIDNLCEESFGPDYFYEDQRIGMENEIVCVTEEIRMEKILVKI